jgi:hypothetical protein
LRQGRAETSNLIARQRRDHITQFLHRPAAAPLLESAAAAGSQVVRRWSRRSTPQERLSKMVAPTVDQKPSQTMRLWSDIEELRGHRGE